MTTLEGTNRVVVDVLAERDRQREMYPSQTLPDGTDTPGDFENACSARLSCMRREVDGSMTWRHVLAEEVAEAFAEKDYEELRGELVQVAAVAAAWIEDLDRKQAAAKGETLYGDGE